MTYVRKPPTLYTIGYEGSSSEEFIGFHRCHRSHLARAVSGITGARVLHIDAAGTHSDDAEP